MRVVISEDDRKKGKKFVDFSVETFNVDGIK
jgi:hypothetical protein